MSFLDCNGALIPYSYEPWRDEGKQRDSECENIKINFYLVFHFFLSPHPQPSSSSSTAAAAFVLFSPHTIKKHQQKAVAQIE